MPKYKLVVYYSVRDLGDGSAYPYWFSSERLALWDQEGEEYMWGEPCMGSITLESESVINPKFDIYTPLSYLQYLIDSAWSDRGWKRVYRFIDDFFEGVPPFELEKKRP